MEFELQSSGVCSKCIGVDKCTRCCAYHLGKAFVNFITNVQVIETRIGEYDSRVKGTKPDLVVYGHQIWDLGLPSWLLTDISTILNVSDKFTTAYDKSAFQIASIYCKFAGYSAEETKEITDKIKAINSNKMLLLPFKPKSECYVDLVADGVKEKKLESKIEYLKWTTNKETHKLECMIGFSAEKFNGSKTFKLSIEDYLTKFRLSQIDIKSKGAKEDTNLIKMTHHGIIKPIVIKEGKTSVAIDGTYLYYVVNGDTSIIGYWNDKNELVINNNIKGKAITKIKDNVDFIKDHKKYIAPYMMYEPNIIEVKSK
jgi:hypothetical protein